MGVRDAVQKEHQLLLVSLFLQVHGRLQVLIGERGTLEEEVLEVLFPDQPYHLASWSRLGEDLELVGSVQDVLDPRVVAL